MITTLKNQTIAGARGRALVFDVAYIQTASPLPVVLFCHGFKGYKDWGAWNLMACTLAAAGVLCVKFNYSHNGGTVHEPIDFPDLEAFGNNNYSLEVHDTQCMLNWITQTSLPVDLSRVYVMGHSRAGGITTLVAASNHTVKGLITLAGVADFAARFPQGDTLAAWKNEGVMFIDNARTRQQMPLYYQFYEDFLAHEQQLHILNAAQKLNIPHIIIHGDADPTVAVTDAYALHKHSAKSELHIIRGADHVFGARHPWPDSYMPAQLHSIVQCVLNFIRANR